MDELARALLGWLGVFGRILGLILRGRSVRCVFGFEPSELISQAPSSHLLGGFIVVWHDCVTRFHASLGCTFRAAQVECLFTCFDGPAIRVKRFVSPEHERALGARTPELL